MVTSNSGVYLAVQIYSLGKTNSNVVIKKKNCQHWHCLHTRQKNTFTGCHLATDHTAKLLRGCKHDRTLKSAGEVKTKSISVMKISSSSTKLKWTSLHRGHFAGGRVLSSKYSGCRCH